MSLPVFYAPAMGTGASGPIAEGSPVVLDGPEGRHAVTVARIGRGDHVHLIDGEGIRVLAEVTGTIGKDQLQCRVLECETILPPSPRIVVVQGIPKSARAELAVDLACQAGADEIIPWQAERCIAKWDGKKADKARAKWQDQALSTAKQARRTTIAQIGLPVGLAGLVDRVRQHVASGGVALILHEEATTALGSVACEEAPAVLVIVGPEGGISPREAEALEKAGAQAVRLGPEVVRTAAAAMVALSALGMKFRWS